MSRTERKVIAREINEGDRLKFLNGDRAMTRVVKHKEIDGNLVRLEFQSGRGVQRLEVKESRPLVVVTESGSGGHFTLA